MIDFFSGEFSFFLFFSIYPFLNSFTKNQSYSLVGFLAIDLGNIVYSAAKKRFPKLFLFPLLRGPPLSPLPVCVTVFSINLMSSQSLQVDAFHARVCPVSNKGFSPFAPVDPLM